MSYICTCENTRMGISPVHYIYILTLWQMFLYEAAGVLVVASPLPPEVCMYMCILAILPMYHCMVFIQDKSALMSGLLLPLVQKFPLYLEQVHTCS